jgi:hypothetical protein
MPGAKCFLRWMISHCDATMILMDGISTTAVCGDVKHLADHIFAEGDASVREIRSPWEAPLPKRLEYARRSTWKSGNF